MHTARKSKMLLAQRKDLILIYQHHSSGRIWQRSIFKLKLTGLNSEFSFFETSWLTKAEDPSLPYYLSIAGGIIIGFIPFLMVLVLCEMQSVSSRIWTRVAVSISYNDNHYTKLPLRARADLGSLSMKGYSTFPKAPVLLEPHHQIV